LRIRPPNSLFFYADESDFLLKPLLGRTYQLAGKQSRVPATFESKKFHCFAALEIGTLDVVHITRQRKRSKEFVEFLEALLRRYPGVLKILVIDNYSIHNSAEVRRFLGAHPGEFELLYLPTYSPWLNPVEDLWRVIKDAICRNVYHGDIERLREALDTEIEERSYENAVRSKLAA